MMLRVTLAVAVVCGMLTVAGMANAADGLAEKLVGEWHGNADKTAEYLKEQGVDQEEIDEIIEEIGNVTLVIAEDNKFIVKIPDAPEALEGEWKLKSEDEEKKQVIMTMTLFGEPMDFTFKFMEGGFIGVNPEGEQTAIFEKKDD